MKWAEQEQMFCCVYFFTPNCAIVLQFIDDMKKNSPLFANPACNSRHPHHHKTKTKNIKKTVVPALQLE
jgi:hypothetical protein